MRAIEFEGKLYEPKVLQTADGENAKVSFETHVKSLAESNLSGLTWSGLIELQTRLFNSVRVAYTQIDQDLSADQIMLAYDILKGQNLWMENAMSMNERGVLDWYTNPSGTIQNGVFRKEGFSGMRDSIKLEKGMSTIPSLKELLTINNMAVRTLTAKLARDLPERFLEEVTVLLPPTDGRIYPVSTRRVGGFNVSITYAKPDATAESRGWTYKNLFALQDCVAEATDWVRKEPFGKRVPDRVYKK